MNESFFVLKFLSIHLLGNNSHTAEFYYYFLSAPKDAKNAGEITLLFFFETS